jgi:hypothetical protein
VSGAARPPPDVHQRADDVDEDDGGEDRPDGEPFETLRDRQHRDGTEEAQEGRRRPERDALRPGRAGEGGECRAAREPGEDVDRQQVAPARQLLELAPEHEDEGDGTDEVEQVAGREGDAQQRPRAFGDLLPPGGQPQHLLEAGNGGQRQEDRDVDGDERQRDRRAP